MKTLKILVSIFAPIGFFACLAVAFNYFHLPVEKILEEILSDLGYIYLALLTYKFLSK
jgi:hypothetical protein